MEKVVAAVVPQQRNLMSNQGKCLFMDYALYVFIVFCQKDLETNCFFFVKR